MLGLDPIKLIARKLMETYEKKRFNYKIIQMQGSSLVVVDFGEIFE